LCAECQQQEQLSVRVAAKNSFIESRLLEEKLAGKDRLHKLLEKHGTRPCFYCGEPTFPTYLYCSGHCWRANKGMLVTIDGIKDTVRAHAKRLGISRRALQKRIAKREGDIETVAKAPPNRRAWMKCPKCGKRISKYKIRCGCDLSDVKDKQDEQGKGC
jgi:predicted nucleic acid-binding Zn ribbon protein